MKTIYKITLAVCAMIIFAACGNAGTRKDKASEAPKAAVKELNAKEFNQLVYNTSADGLVYLGDKPAIVDFTATWCGPCQRIAPILEELAVEHAKDIVIYKVDIDKERDLAKAFNVSSIPAVLFIPGGDKEPVMTVGSRSKEKFQEEIQTLLLNTK